MYPVFDSIYSWVRVYGTRRFNPAVIKPDDSYIAVDSDVAEYLKEHDIVLEWSRYTKHIQTASIKSVGGKSTMNIVKSGHKFTTLAEIITGTKGTTRGPKNSFHANDWTRSAFDRDVTEPLHELSADEILARVLCHTDRPLHQSMFDLPPVSLRHHILNDDIKYMYPTVITALPVTSYETRYKSNDTLDGVVSEFEEKMAELMPPNKKTNNTSLLVYIIAVTVTVAVTVTLAFLTLPTQ